MPLFFCFVLPSISSLFFVRCWLIFIPAWTVYRWKWTRYSQWREQCRERRGTRPTRCWRTGILCWRLVILSPRNCYSALLNVILCCMSTHIIFAWKLVEENVHLKPIDGPSNGHREEKEEEKKPEEDEASGSEGKNSMLFLCWHRFWGECERECERKIFSRGFPCFLDGEVSGKFSFILKWKSAESFEEFIHRQWDLYSEVLLWIRFLFLKGKCHLMHLSCRLNDPTHSLCKKTSSSELLW